MKRYFSLAIVAAVLAGCGTVPMTPGEYRQAARAGQSYSTYETFEVTRPVAAVGQTFKTKAKECLSFAIGSTKRPMIGVGSSTRYYGLVTPTVKASDRRAELHVQIQYENTVGNIPKNGAYYLVADAYPTAKGTTRVDIYRWTKMETVGVAIKGWASGRNMGCPDPSTFL